MKLSRLQVSSCMPEQKPYRSTCVRTKQKPNYWDKQVDSHFYISKIVAKCCNQVLSNLSLAPFWHIQSKPKNYWDKKINSLYYRIGKIIVKCFNHGLGNLSLTPLWYMQSEKNNHIKNIKYKACDWLNIKQ